MLRNSKSLPLFFSLLLSVEICFAETVYLKCDGNANRSSIMGDTSTFPFSTSVELDETNKYIDISRILEVAPNIEYPFQKIYFGKEKIFFTSKKEVPGDFVDVKGEINRFTEEMTINYTNINPKSSDKILTIKTTLVCKAAPSRKF